LAVNSRVERLYGPDAARFLEWLQSGELAQIRNRALYLERDGERLVAPNESIGKTDARLIVCMAGEAYAEIQGVTTGTGPREQSRILAEVDAFRCEEAR
jgi:hypothetical protein